ncbi:hypothetical protein LDENG_00265420 [Lucifuga dentata]|nr:hypothetical protein LDENG_00265420 [Lucifuga dentata]
MSKTLQQDCSPAPTSLLFLKTFSGSPYNNGYSSKSSSSPVKLSTTRPPPTSSILTLPAAPSFLLMATSCPTSSMQDNQNLGRQGILHCCPLPLELSP